MKNKIVFFNRSAPHYRKGIYSKMDQQLSVDFYFGDKRPGSIKKMDYSFLRNFKGELSNIDIGSFYWQKGVFKLLFSKSYKYYITPGDFNCISNWILFPLLKLQSKKIFFW